MMLVSAPEERRRSSAPSCSLPAQHTKVAVREPTQGQVQHCQLRAPRPAQVDVLRLVCQCGVSPHTRVSQPPIRAIPAKFRLNHAHLGCIADYNRARPYLLGKALRSRGLQLNPIGCPSKLAATLVHGLGGSSQTSREDVQEGQGGLLLSGGGARCDPGAPC